MENTICESPPPTELPLVVGPADVFARTNSINGTKKWITNGMWADYFVTGCKTEKGFSVILVPRDDNVETKRIKTSYSTAAATTFIQFDNVKVPVNHLLGKEDNGVSCATLS
jgi:alkylation response protein AidB-like acyl-CoA dehydrogenase